MRLTLSFISLDSVCSETLLDIAKRFFVLRTFVICFCYLLLQSHEQLWMAAAQKLTNLIKQIIEFAKMVPGFMKLNQDDQIVLLKKGKQISVAAYQVQ